MKKFFLSLSVVFAAYACTQSPQGTENTSTENDQAEATEMLHYFGAEISPENAVASTELIAMMEGKDSLNVKIEGKINECCQTKGCWMDVDLGNGESMIVKFKDYEFFVPKNSAGQTAIMEGVARMEVQTVEWLQHKAQDAGKSKEEIAAITEPEMKMSFMADGVIIKGAMEVEAETEVEETVEEANASEHVSE